MYLCNWLHVCELHVFVWWASGLPHLNYGCRCRMPHAICI